MALYIRGALDNTELEINMVECLWLRIKGKANKAGILVGACHKPPNQNGEVDQLFDKQLENISQLPALVLVGAFNLPDTFWELSREESV